MSVLIPSLRAAIAVPQWSKNELWRRARAVPSLDLRFADNKSLVDATTGTNLVNFSRGTGGTYVDSQGVLRTALVDEPRFDHSPTTGESLGLLVEESRTNLLLRSEEFDNAYWTLGGGLVTPNATTAPDETLTADLYTTTGAGQSIYPLSGTAVSPSTSYTFSVYVKLGTMAPGDYKLAFYDVTNAAFIAVDVVPAQVPTTVAWTRVRYTLTTPAGCTNLRAYPFRSGPSIPSSTVYLWGAQLEAGSFPTSYIKNVDTPGGVTRAADVASITTLGANVRSLFSQFRSPASGTRPIVSLDDNTANERIELFTSGTDPKLLVTDGGSAQADIDAGAITANTTARLAARFNTDNFAASVSGGTEVLDASGTMPTVDRIRIGRDQAGNYLNGHIARLAGWDSSLELLSSITQ